MLGIQCFCAVMYAIVRLLLILMTGDDARMGLAYARLVRLALVIFIISMAGVAVGLPRSVKADSSSPLDGIGQGPCNSAAPVINCSTQLLTTTQSNDVVIIVAEGTNSTTVSDSSGLSFVQRVSYSSTTYPSHTMVEFYAVAASPLNNDNITVSDAPRYTNGMQAFAIHGADTASLFDQDPSIPATVSCPGPDCGNCYADYNTNPGTCSASIQTSASDFVVATTAINDALPCGGYPTSPAGYVPPPGFTHILAGDSFEVDYTLSANPPNSVKFDCNATDASAIVLDAIVMSSATSPSTISWQGFDWDGGSETTLTLNNQRVASLPTVASPQNAGVWAGFDVNTTMLVPGLNTLTFTHAQWDCGVSDNVQNFQVTSGSTVVYSNSTELPLDCNHSITYTFTV